MKTAAIYELIEVHRSALGLSQNEVARRAFGSPKNNHIQSLRRGNSPTAETLGTLCRALGLEFYIGPPRGSADPDSPDTPARPAWSRFTDSTLPQHGIAKCGVQGWGKDQPEREPLPRPEDIMDEQAFWVTASGQSMIPEGIDGGAICLVSPGTEARDGDRVWILDHQGGAAIKRLIRRDSKGHLHLRGWMPKQDGQQKSFDEQRLPAGVRKVHPVVAVFRGRPGAEGCEYIPDPKPPEHAMPPETPAIVPPERIPHAITDLLGLPGGADADAVVAAIRAQLAGRGTAKASPAAALDKRTLERTLKSETRNVLDKLDAIEARLPAPPDPARGAEVVPRPIPSGAGAESGAREGDVRIQLAQDVRTAAGAGEEVFEESTDMHVVLPAEALPRPVRPDRLIALYAEGRSMEPTIRPGEMLVMDRGRCEPREGGIFVLRTDTGLVVKRLKQEGESWRMTSDNPDWPARDVGQDDRVLGHVVWFGPEKIVEAGG